jgi:hypothetical protein
MNSKTQDELKHQLTKELLVMNERFYNFYTGNVKKPLIIKGLIIGGAGEHQFRLYSTP